MQLFQSIRRFRLPHDLRKSDSYNWKGSDFMGKVTIYLDSETEEKLKKITRKQGISKSKWISALIQEKTVSTWPESISKLAGAWADIPMAEEMRISISPQTSPLKRP
jgi:hypothetical protein